MVDLLRFPPKSKSGTGVTAWSNFLPNCFYLWIWGVWQCLFECLVWVFVIRLFFALNILYAPSTPSMCPVCWEKDARMLGALLWYLLSPLRQGLSPNLEFTFLPPCLSGFWLGRQTSNPLSPPLLPTHHNKGYRHRKWLPGFYLGRRDLNSGLLTHRVSPHPSQFLYVLESTLNIRICLRKNRVFPRD